ncbi:hypothetical protein BDP81DRAFT_70514 [Colletotrichum phormii]|uniref:Uncharacterized protein n=1 Tax=Colletotrichum phormii TaxID=359342 RepID=A0AAI9ZKN6_9PEZI|nr:uncharacterized protein BDP81DRAFT_70514 [Colletotrichum phormii]KAK1633748.1 hypothetical protein BDP81DRAFT_70514 [Colletotrichum phormii]
MYRDRPRLRGGGDDAEDDEMDCGSSPIRHQQPSRLRTPSPRRNNNMDTAMTDGEQQWPEPPGAPRWHWDENDPRNPRNAPTQTSAVSIAGSTNPHVGVNPGSGDSTPGTGLGQTYCLFHSNYSASARSQCRLVPNSSLEEMYNCGSQGQDSAPPKQVDAAAETMSMHSQTSTEEPDVQMSDDTSSPSAMLSPPAPAAPKPEKRKASPEAELPEKKRAKDEGPNHGPHDGQGYVG